ncbi:aminopeptidase [Alicyclobacillus kakegawensis]|uniref:aminopeptidase n=1 Tax=Alicyclobacillus kakegawensis TaxID=392012 RepID=UPI000833AF39|nr:aminopeptidase [Alicyclobacillus kakegawensis]
MLADTHLLTSYAELAIEMGVNLQPDQTLVVVAPVVACEFVRCAVETAYRNGAKAVHVLWDDDRVTHARLQHERQEQLQQYPAWKAQAYRDLIDARAAFLTVVSPHPKLMDDVPTEHMALAMRAASQALAGYREALQSAQVNWSIVAVPNDDWAREVYPQIPTPARLERLWQALARVIRLDTANPMEAWRQHLGRLTRRIETLNGARFRQLRYQGPGTDLRIGLPNEHVWLGGGTKNQDGVLFVPNLPTEECFTAPVKTEVEGVVCSTRPLLHGGQWIEDFELRFSEGRIVEYRARVGQDVLASILDTDEGARFLGEVALVPHSSPVSREGVTFCHTLLDENASCHLAIGSAYPMNLRDGAQMSREQRRSKGLNESLVHVDFMVGSAELDIDGLDASGRWVPILRQGEWAARFA